MLADLLSGEIYAFALVFARLGAALMLMPPFGDTFVFPRARLALALAIAAVVTPLVAPSLPALPSSALVLALALSAEIAVGLFIGGLARLLLSALHTASIFVAYQTGLGMATVFDPNQQEQVVVVSRFFSMLALVLLFATNLHHALILALVDSYETIPPGGLPPVADFAAQAVAFIAGAFTVALRVAAPVLVLGTLFFVGIGLLARLMPAMQVFFVALPLQIVLGFWVLSTTLSGAMLWYLEYFRDSIGTLVRGG